jgi:hypothetical protein
MYTALLGCLTTPGLDGMRFALFLFKFSVFKTLTDSRFPERRLDRGAISFFAGRPGRKIRTPPPSPVCGCGNRASDFQAWCSSRRHLQAVQMVLPASSGGL